jgi:hypothetical protein
MAVKRFMKQAYDKMAEKEMLVPGIEVASIFFFFLFSSVAPVSSSRAQSYQTF